MKHDTPIEVLYAIVAGAGGVARHVSQYLQGGKFDWHILIANMFLSGFSGFMFALFARSLSISGDMIFVFSGVGGYMSSSTLEWLYRKIRK